VSPAPRRAPAACAHSGPQPQAPNPGPPGMLMLTAFPPLPGTCGYHRIPQSVGRTVV